MAIDTSGASVGGRLVAARRALVDTNVALDLLLGREPWASQAKPMWDAHDAGRLELYLSASTVTDIFYICRKQVGADRARMAIMDCLNRLNILLIDRTLLTAALSLSGPDYEDNIQIACAQAASLDLIITRDAAGFAHAACLLSRRLTSRGICRSHNLSRNRLPLATAMTLAEKI